MLIKCIRKLNKARIILRIWLKSIYQITVNYLTTGESVPRVPQTRRVKDARSGCDQVVQVFLRHYTVGIKARAGKFRSIENANFHRPGLVIFGGEWK